MRSSPRVWIAEHAVRGWFTHETGSAHSGVPAVVGKMMKGALRNGTTGPAICFECNCNIEPSTRRLAHAASNYPSSRTSWCAHCTFVWMTREKLDQATGRGGIA